MTSSPDDRINLDDVPDSTRADFDALARTVRIGPKRDRPSLRKAARHMALAAGAMLLVLSLVFGMVYATARLARNGSPDAVVARFLALTRDGDEQSARRLCIPTVSVSVRDFERPELVSTRTAHLDAEIAEVRVRGSIRRNSEPYYRRGDFVFTLAREKGKGEWKLLSIR